MRSVALFIGLAACGRLGFGARVGDAGDGGDDAGDEDAAIDATLPTTNIVFVAGPIVPGSIGSLASADLFCNDVAHASDLPGTFVAWLSTSTVNAIDRLAGARGWTRPDGAPFADLPTDIVAHKIFYPPEQLASGTTQPVIVATGTRDTGTLSLFGNCSDYTTTGGGLGFGTSTATGGYFTDINGTQPCSMATSIYCFETDHATPVSLPSKSIGRTIFESTGWVPASGIGAADAHCNQDAVNAGLSGTYLAVLSITGTAAASRFVDDGMSIVRTDGVTIAATLADFMSGTLIAPPNVDGTGTIYSYGNVWAGASSLQSTPTVKANQSCSDWSPVATNQAVLGLDASATGYFGQDPISNTNSTDQCTSPHGLLCLRQ